MRKLLIVGVIVLATGGAVTAALLLRKSDGTAGAQQRAKVRVAYMPGVANAPLYTAIERGYFAMEGVDVELISCASTSAVMPAFLSGEADVASGSAVDVLIAATTFPGTFKTFRASVGSGDDCNDAIVVRKGASYKSLADLKGKKLGTIPGATVAMVLRVASEKLFGDRGAIEQVPMPPAALLGSLASGGIDAAFVLEPVAITGEKEGVCQYLERGPMARYIMDPYVYNLAVISQKYIDEHPREAQAFVRAHSAGIMDYRKDRASTAPHIAKYTKMPPDIADRVPVARSLLPAEYPAEALEKLVELLLREKLLASRPDIRNLAFEP